eukprot:TRINITY_DN4403_c0_g1_i4.p1 TRINITY_DN4403_c0_g1~~TRINITY_DN4403_c0_g1_i4.p1  ORF type:complete len:683 (-),score=113.82 TRINITY_DN4403_c0_g1_i4:35-2083(-)
MGVFSSLYDRIRYGGGGRGGHHHVPKRRPITMRDRLLMSPFAKWNVYGKFPWKCLLHVLIVVLLVVQSLIVNNVVTGYMNTSQDTFKAVFLPDVAIENKMYYAKDVLEAVNNTVAQYYSFPEQAIDFYEYVYIGKEISPITLTIVSLTDDDDVLFDPNADRQNVKVHTQTRTYIQTEHSPLGPFNESVWQDQAFRVQRIQQQFLLRNINVNSLGPVQYIWSFSITYDFWKSGGQVGIDFKADARVDSSSGLPPIVIFPILNCALILTALLSLILSSKHLFKNRQLYYEVKKRFECIPGKSMAQYPFQSWEAIPMRVKLKFFSYWNVFNIIGNICVIIAACLDLGENFGTLYIASYARQVLLGVAGAFSCFYLIRYLQYSQKCYMLIQVIEKSFFRVFRFCFSCAPIYLGYALCGVALFSQYSDRFMTLSDTCETLFYLLNGDEIHATFAELNADYPIPVLPSIFLYSFVGLWIFIILNVFIFIIEAAYDSTKKENSYYKKSMSKTRWSTTAKFNLKDLLDIIETEISFVDVDTPLLDSDGSGLHRSSSTPSLQHFPDFGQPHHHHHHNAFRSSSTSSSSNMFGGGGGGVGSSSLNSSSGVSFIIPNSSMELFNAHPEDDGPLTTDGKNRQQPEQSSSKLVLLQTIRETRALHEREREEMQRRHDQQMFALNHILDQMNADLR